MAFRKPVLINLSAEKEWRCGHREQMFRHTRERRGSDELRK